MALLRTEAEGFRHGEIPAKGARAFEGAAMLVAISTGGRLDEGGGIEEIESRAAANAVIGIGDLIGALREVRSRAGIVGRAAAEINGERCAGMPANDIEQTPIAQGMFLPAMIGVAAAFPEGQFVGRGKAQLVTHIEG